MGCKSSRAAPVVEPGLTPAVQEAGPVEPQHAPPPPTATVQQPTEIEMALAKLDAGGMEAAEAKPPPPQLPKETYVDPTPGPAEEGFPEPCVFNGFKCMIEGPAIVCSEGGMAEYTLPAEALVYQPAEETILSKFKNGDAERKIHNNIKISEAEMTCLKKVQELAMQQDLSFYPSVTSMASRFISRARNEPKKALKLMQDTQAWREEYFKGGPIREESVREDLKLGIIYFTGRDSALRPGIVIRAVRIPQKWYDDKAIDRFIKLLIFSMEYFLRYMIVPGKVENLSVIVDLNGLGLAQVPVGALRDVYKVMSHHYIGRVYKFYVINMSSGLSFIAGMAKAILTDRQKQKLNMLDDVSELAADFGRNQLEQELGGSRPAFTTFWPFPLLPGPYDAGADRPYDAAAVPGVHYALSKRGAMGRMWDESKSVEENTRLDWGCRAARILRTCNFPIPAELQAEADKFDRVGASPSCRSDTTVNGNMSASASPAKSVGTANPDMSPMSPATPYSNPDLSKEVLIDELEVGVPEMRKEQPALQTGSVCGGSLFCC